MPKSLITYFSQGGTTARVAEHIANGLRTAGHHVDLCNIKNERLPDLGGYDLLGIGSPVYYFRPPFNVTDLLRSLPNLAGLSTFVFVLHGTYPFDAANPIRRTLARKGAREVGYFHCYGADFFLGYLREGYLFSPNHPTEDELAEAEAFGGEVATHFADKQQSRPKDDRPPTIVYRVERFLTNRWLARHVYSRVFTVNTNCNGCGLCMKLCPIGNLAEDKDKRPVWGRNCLLCLTCEMKCPKDAIISPARWPLFRPFLIYNVRHASRDPSLDYVRATHSSGRTRLMKQNA